MPDYAKHYSDVKFWQKVKTDFRGMGRSVLVPAFELFNVLKSPRTPTWAKAVAIGALGYLILPFDFVPDMVPAAGFADDLFALMTAIQAISRYVTPRVIQESKTNVENLF